MADKRRLTLEFGAEAYSRLEVLKDLSEATSKTETIRNAMVLYNYALGAVLDGGRVLIEDADGNIIRIVGCGLPVVDR